MCMSKFLKISLALALMHPVLANADKAPPIFEFQDSECIENQSADRSARSIWRDGYQEVEVNTTMNCSYSAQRPEYKLSGESIVFKYETIPMEADAASLCECTHKILFKLKVENKLKAATYENDVEVPIKVEGEPSESQ